VEGGSQRRFAVGDSVGGAYLGALAAGDALFWVNGVFVAHEGNGVDRTLPEAGVTGGTIFMNHIGHGEKLLRAAIPLVFVKSA
jgi:hypothetical protein